MPGVRAGPVSARNAAITLLALTTGLRACDIIGAAAGRCRLARPDDRIVQQKTGNPLTLPLPALVMGKLADYVLGRAARPRLMITCSSARWRRTCGWPITLRCTR